MGLGASFKRFVISSACVFLLPLASPCLADPPPIGYVGPAPIAIGSSLPPPIGYVGPAPTQTNIPIPNAPTPPPIGYVGPIARPLPRATEKPLKAADDTNSDHPGETLITAKQMHSDSVNGIVTASGDVEIVRANYILHADKVIYNQKTGIMVADGHVALLTPTGEVEFSRHQEITGDMKQAFAANVGILFPDNSRMAANAAQRYDERYTVADKAVYTSCNICRQNPAQEPLWQMKADTITHDNVDHKIYYHDATLDVGGVPVAYTPYLSAPDPTVKREQGFLNPSPGYSPNIGTYFRVPYYVDIAPDKDATITPTFSETDKLQLATQYRERFDQGNLQFLGSITYADLINDTGGDTGYHLRGDLFGTFLYDIDNTWRAGTDVQYASDKSYLARYDISSLDQTTTRAYLEGFKGQNYAALNSYYFQDLRPGFDASEPVVLPSATVSMRGAPNQTLGGRWSFDGNTLITQRDTSETPPLPGNTSLQEGTDTRRLSLNGGWQRQFISDTGLETTVSGLLRTDSYWANNVVAANGSGQVYDQAIFTRQFEQANAVMRYPMGRSGENYQQILEPIVALTAAPDVRQISKQPIEDSLDVQFDASNLFSPNRFTGSDLIEGGSRATYGIRNAITMDSGSRVDIFGGESYDFSSNDEFPELSGLDKHASDYVGRIDFMPVDWINANYGFRLAESNFSPQQEDVNLVVGRPIFQPSIRYIEAYETDTTTGLIDQVKEATVGLSSTFEKYWNITGSHTQGFDPDPGPRTSSLTLTYVDECFGAGVGISHDDTNRVDISSGTSVAFHFFLKNLGGIHTDSSTGVQFPTEFRQTTP